MLTQTSKGRAKVDKHEGDCCAGQAKDLESEIVPEHIGNSVASRPTFPFDVGRRRVSHTTAL